MNKKYWFILIKSVFYAVLIVLPIVTVLILIKSDIFYYSYHDEIHVDNLVGFSLGFSILGTIILFVLNILNLIWPFYWNQYNRHLLLTKIVWTLVDGSEKVNYKFNRKYLSENEFMEIKNGKVSEGKWKYFNNNRSIIVEIENKKTLYNINKISKELLILEIDGIDNELTFTNLK